MALDDITFPSVSRRIWDAKYRLRAADGAPIDRSLEDTWARVARSAAEAERKRDRRRWTEAFQAAMADFAFLPAGRILAGAGSGRRVTLFNCFVMGRIADDLSAIFEQVKEAALTMQQGGGIGHDFSTLRPRGALVKSIGADASGPVSFMHVWDAMCRTIMSAGARRGAMMATMRCDHPDIEEFIAAKAEAGRLSNFNLSVLVTDAFIAAVRADEPWPLSFEGHVTRTVRARELWDRIMRATYDYAEPGVIFIDRVNAMNNLAYCEDIHATNPCGEQPLPPYGACLLGSINLARLVTKPFTPEASLDTARLEDLTRVAVRFLDDIIDVSGYPLPAQQREAKAKRRIGLGVTGLADALILCGLRYGTPEAVAAAGSWMARLERAAYTVSAELAREKGTFPLYEPARHLAAPGIMRLDADVRELITRHGLRNGLLTSVAPTGTISLLAGNVSSGVEPVFDFAHTRRMLGADGKAEEVAVDDYAYRLYRHIAGETAPLGPAFVTAAEIAPSAHLAMQAALQGHVDSSISKTINCPADISFERFKSVYLEAYDQGLKGCTTYRPNAVTGAVLVAGGAGPADGAAVSDEAPSGSATAGSTTETPNAAGPAPRMEPAREAGALRVVEGRSPPAGRRGDGEGTSAADVFYMAKPLERDPVLTGFTYKLRWPDSDHALYITINDIVRDGRRRPFEIFINSKNLEHYAWTVALTRMISAVFRRGGDVAFVVEELKAVFDPRGGQWMGGRYVPSLLAAIGGVIEQHMIDTGFLQREGRGPPPALEAEVAGGPGGGGVHGSGPQGANRVARPRADAFCPKCGEGDLVREEGCWVCRSCGYSKCS